MPAEIFKVWLFVILNTSEKEAKLLTKLATESLKDLIG
jgi:hypothetical protein